MARLKLATVWLAGCSGCHMSFLDLDEWLVELAQRADIVYTPFIDIKEFPDNVDVTLVEGAVANEDNLRHLLNVRQRSRVLISFGDCAVTGNVTAIRNQVGGREGALRRSYVELSLIRPMLPADPVLPPLLEWVKPVHEVVPVEFYMPGCPPPADRIKAVLAALLDGKPPHLEGEAIKFG